MEFVGQYLSEARAVLERIDPSAVARVVEMLAGLKARQGRLFILGVGGGAAHASHAVNDFRKIAQIEAYAPTDNVSELTARTNDEGWESTFVNWLKGSRLRPTDMVFVLSVGGGNIDKNVSPNLVSALRYAKEIGVPVCGVVGRDGGYTGAVADAWVQIPTVNSETITPHTESFQAVIWHLLVSHPRIKEVETKWESVNRQQ